MFDILTLDPPFKLQLELERRQRIFNSKRRLIGIDQQARAGGFETMVGTTSVTSARVEYDLAQAFALHLEFRTHQHQEITFN